MSNPCPRDNGTTIGTSQEFVLHCDSSLSGDTLSSEDADSFLECVDLCADSHPKCEGVIFNRRTCDLMAGIRIDDDSRRFDAAVAQFPRATSSCDGLGTQSQGGGKTFDLFCGNLIDGNDLSQNFAPTFVDCMDQCSATDACSGVSFDASMNNGFKNCYMKGSGNSEPSLRAGMDTAIVANINAAAAPIPASSNSGLSP
jgi:PAN domain-containing protein